MAFAHIRFLPQERRPVELWISATTLQGVKIGFRSKGLCFTQSRLSWSCLHSYLMTELGIEKEERELATSRIDVWICRICSWPLTCRTQILQDSCVVVGV